MTERKYEIAYIFSTAGESTEQFCQSIRDGLKELDVTVENENDMGTRTLSYPIRKQSSGHYYIFTVRMAPAVAYRLGDYYKQNAGVLRHLVVRLEK